MKKIVFLMITTLFLLSGCSSLVLKSPEYSGNLDKIDSYMTNHTIYLEDEEVSLSVIGTEKKLYINFTPSENIRKTIIMNRGFTLWFDPDGNSNKEYGLKFIFNNSKPNVKEREFRGKKQFNELNNKISYEISLLNEDRVVSTYSIEELHEKGISTDIKIEDNKMTCRINMPFNISDETMPSINKNEIFSIGFDSPRPSKPGLNKRMRTKSPGGASVMGGSTSFKGGNRKMKGKGGFPSPKKLDLWLNIDIEK